MLNIYHAYNILNENELTPNIRLYLSPWYMCRMHTSVFCVFVDVNVAGRAHGDINGSTWYDVFDDLDNSQGLSIIWTSYGRPPSSLAWWSDSWCPFFVFNIES
jgi:hypothetical protein